MRRVIIKNNETKPPYITPGDWKVNMMEPSRPGVYVIDRLGYPHLVAKVNPDNDESPSSARANAHLLCAAPKLYKALSKLVIALAQEEQNQDREISVLCTDALHVLSEAEHGAP